MRVNNIKPAVSANKTAVRADTMLQKMLNLEPVEVDAWINANVNDLADVKRVLRVLCRAVIHLSEGRR